MKTDQSSIHEKIQAIEHEAYSHGKTYANRKRAALEARLKRQEMLTAYIQDIIRIKDREIEALKASIKSQKQQKQLF